MLRRCCWDALYYTCHMRSSIWITSSSATTTTTTTSTTTSHPPHPLPLLHTLLRHIRFTRYLQHFRHVGTSYEASNFTCEFSNSSIRFLNCFWGVGGCAGRMMTTLLRRHPNNISGRAILLGIYSTFVTSAILYSCQAYLWTLLRCLFAFASAFSENSKLVGGKLFLLGL